VGSSKRAVSSGKRFQEAAFNLVNPANLVILLTTELGNIVLNRIAGFA
jgi:hypothetical protein